MQIKNYMEDLVWTRLDAVMERVPAACRCEKCRHDVAALALNFLPPRYFVTDKGEMYSRVKALEVQFDIDVITAITNAIKIVNAQPHHGNNNK